MQWPLRKCRHEEMLSMLPLPPSPHPRHLPDACPGGGLQPHRAPVPPAQPTLWKVAPMGKGGRIQPQLWRG